MTKIDTSLKRIYRENCFVCGNSGNLTLHHIFPRKYLKYLSDKWKLEGNIVTLCCECHQKFEIKICEWYSKIENSVVTKQRHQERVFFKRLRLFHRLSNDRKLYKFIVLCRYKFYEITGTKLNGGILKNLDITKYDSSLREYLNA